MKGVKKWPAENNRPYKPHYYKGDTYHSKFVEEAGMTVAEIARYKMGYDQTPQGKDF
jgi:hypothetical protein